MVARLTPDGNPDVGFAQGGGNGGGGAGFRVDAFTGGVNQAGSVALQDDKIIVAGQSGGNVLVARYTSTGQLDTSFQGTGSTTIDGLKTSDAVVGLAVQDDDKILVSGNDEAGTLSGSDFLLARLNTNGSPDTAFGEGGVAKTDMGGTEDADSVVISRNGIFVTGTRTTDRGSDASSIVVNTAVALYDAVTGEPVRTFGSGGYTFFNPETVSLTGTATGLGAANVPGIPGVGSFAASAAALGDGLATARGNPKDFKSIIDALLPREAATPPVEDVDVEPPVPNMTGGLTLAASQADFSFTIEFTDSSGVDATDIGVDDILVTRNGTPLVVKSATPQTPPGSGMFAVAYTVAPADNFFGRLDSGTYSVVLQAGQVSDTFGIVSSTDQQLAGFTVAIDPAPVGTFGGRTKFTFADPGSGTPVTFTMKVGQGTVYVENNRFDIDLSGTTTASALNMKARGPITLGNIVSTGSLKSVAAKTATLLGVMSVNGSLGKTTLGSLSGATLAAAGAIAGLTVGSIGSSNILTGTNLGADLALGGGDDAFTGASLGKTAIRGAVSNTTFAAGVNPGAGSVFGDGNDAGTGGGIATMTIKGGADANTRFYGTFFPRTAKMPAKVIPSADPRFVILA